MTTQSELTAEMLDMLKARALLARIIAAARNGIESEAELGAELTEEMLDEIACDCVLTHSSGDESPHKLAMLIAAARKGLSEAWRPIETAPKDGTRLILWDVDIGDVDVGRWSVGNDCWVNEDHGLTLTQNKICLPTHWMPLPEPPARLTQEGKP